MACPYFNSHIKLTLNLLALIQLKADLWQCEEHKSSLRSCINVHTASNTGTALLPTALLARGGEEEEEKTDPRRTGEKRWRNGPFATLSLPPQATACSACVWSHPSAQGRQNLQPGLKPFHLAASPKPKQCRDTSQYLERYIYHNHKSMIQYCSYTELDMQKSLFFNIFENRHLLWNILWCLKALTVHHQMYYTGPLKLLLTADNLINYSTTKLGLFNSLLDATVDEFECKVNANTWIRWARLLITFK